MLTCRSRWVFVVVYWYGMANVYARTTTVIYKKMLDFLLTCMVTGGDDMEPSFIVFVSTCLPHHRGNPQTMVDFMRRMEAKHKE